MTDFLAEKRNEITDKLTELRPLVEEYRRLEAAAAALDGIPAAPSGASATSPRSTRGRRGPGRPRGSKTTATPASPTSPASTAKPAAKRKRRRRKRTGKRAEQALALISANPGITIPRLAETMGIKTNYLYRIIPSLAQAGKIRKDGHGWHPKQATPAAA